MNIPPNMEKRASIHVPACGGPGCGLIDQAVRRRPLWLMTQEDRVVVRIYKQVRRRARMCALAGVGQLCLGRTQNIDETKVQDPKQHSWLRPVHRLPFASGLCL
jgi:hypothetical protein